VAAGGGGSGSRRRGGGGDGGAPQTPRLCIDTWPKKGRRQVGRRQPPRGRGTRGAAQQEQPTGGKPPSAVQKRLGCRPLRGAARAATVPAACASDGNAGAQ